MNIEEIREATLKAGLPDVQQTKPAHPHEIVAGVKNVVFPLLIKRKNGTSFATTGNFEMHSFLPADVKGTHMSRFITMLNGLHQEVSSLPRLTQLAKEMREEFYGKSIESGEVTFDELHGKSPNFCRCLISIATKFTFLDIKHAPITKVAGIVHYDVEFETDDANTQKITVTVPITSLCPCSKAISEAGAHNQRANVTVKLHAKPGEFIWIEDIIKEVEKCGSSEMFTALKRMDEKEVTERAYANPKFVEDICRDVIYALKEAFGSQLFEGSVEVVSEESIHMHDAVAFGTFLGE